MAEFPTYNAWLGRRSTSLALKNQYNNARDEFARARSTGRVGPVPPSRTTDPTPPSGRTGPPTRRFLPGSGSTSGRGSGVSWDAGGDHRGLATGTTDPVAPSGGGGRTGIPSSGRGSFGASSGPSGYTGVDPRSTPMPRPGSFGAGSGPSGFGGSGTPPSGGASAAAKGASAAAKGASAAAKGASFFSKAGTVVGKAFNSPVGKMAKLGGKFILPIAGAKLAADTWGAFEPGIDMARYGHKPPWKDGYGGRDHRVNDMLGNISPLEMIQAGKTQEVLSDLTGGRSADFLKKVFPYRERQTAEPAAFKKPDGVGGPKSGGQRAVTPTPRQPDSLPDMSRQARNQNKAMRDPESYLGSAFDATLRKGIETGRNYLQSQMNKDGLDSDDQSKIMARFNDKIADDKELSKASNKSGIVNTIEAKDAGRGQRTLAAYRQQSPQGTYGKGAKAAEIQRKFVKE